MKLFKIQREYINNDGSIGYCIYQRRWFFPIWIYVMAEFSRLEAIERIEQIKSKDGMYVKIDKRTEYF